MTRILPIAIAALLAISAAPAQAQTLPDGFFTVNANELKSETREGNRDVHLARMAAMGVTHVRADMLWNSLEPHVPVDPDNPGVAFDPANPTGAVRAIKLEHYDRFVEALAEHGLTWRPLFGASPSWNRMPGEGFWSPPLVPELATGVVEQMFRRYGVGGSFWSDPRYRHLTPRPIRWVEAWNEPNFDSKNQGDYRYPPESYGRFLQAVALGARAVDPGARVVVGGLVPHTATTGRGIAVREFLARTAAAAPATVGLTTGVGLHIYGTKIADVWWVLKGARDHIVTSPYALAAIHLNETGGSVRPGEEAVEEPQRAALLESLATRAAAASGPACRLGSIAPYAWLTAEQDALDDEHWFGIVRRDATLRPSAEAFAAGIAAAAAGDDPCTRELSALPTLPTLP